MRQLIKPILISGIFAHSQVYAEMIRMTPKPYFDFNAEQGEDILDVEYDKQKTNYSVLSNKLYQNERIKVFNYTAYDRDQISNQLQSSDLKLDHLGDLSVSFGYGIEFRVNPRNKIGYEYLSSFPYDRGELIRLFWVRAL